MCSRVCDVPQVEAQRRREEQRKFGVFFDDDYDYLQHLKEAQGPNELVAPRADWRPLSLCEEDDEDEKDDTENAVTVNLLTLFTFHS